jgi:PPM family protein phosphatase
MAVRVKCPHCSRFCQVEPQHIGKNVRCGQCSNVFAAAEERAGPAPTTGFWAGLKGMVQSPWTPTAPPEKEDPELTLDLDGPAASAPAQPPAVERQQHLRLDLGSATSTGRVRARNEDSHAAQHLSWAKQNQPHETALIVVADGMGGYDAGDKASALIVDQLLAGFGEILARSTCEPMTNTQAAESIDRLIRAAHTAVYQRAQTDPACKGMGATLAVVLIRDTEATVGHVGDCRVYHFSAGRLSQVTRDQTLVARMVELGTLTPQEALTHPQRNEVTQAVGKHPEIKPTSYQLHVGAGDWLVVACDGLHAHVDDAALAAALASAAPSAASVAEHLVDLANQGGGTDNCTVVAVRCW